MTDTELPRRPVVYLIAQPSVSRRKPPPNLAPLYAHGDVVTLCPMGDSPSFQSLRCADAIEDRLASYDPDIDFLVWAGGDTLAAVFVGIFLGSQDIWKFRWLRYERFRLPNGERTDEGASYVPIVIDLTDDGQLVLDITHDTGTEDDDDDR